MRKRSFDVTPMNSEKKTHLLMHQLFNKNAVNYDNRANVNAKLIMHEPKNNLTDNSY